MRLNHTAAGLAAAATLLSVAACANTTGGSPTARASYQGPSPTAATAAATGQAGSDPAATTQVPTPGPSASAEPSAAGAATGAAPAPSVAPLGSAPLPGVPAVTANATDLAKEPVLAAGTGTAATGLVTRDLVVGTGAAATLADTVSVRYVGALFTDGSVFDASWKQGMAPVSFPLNRVVPGFAQGIAGMKLGGRREIVIPPALGYGAQANGPIPAGSTLVFVVDLAKIGA